MAVSVIDSSNSFHTLETMSSGHSGFSSLKLGSSWSVGDNNWMSRRSLRIQS